MSTTPSLYVTEFPTFDDPATCARLLSLGWRDVSHHNDACPSFYDPTGRLRLWVDHLSPELREVKLYTHRLSLYRVPLDSNGHDTQEYEHPNHCLYEGDELPDALAQAAAFVAR